MISTGDIWSTVVCIFPNSTMCFFHFISIFIFIFALFNSFSVILAQQPYVGLATTDCPRMDNSDSIRGYTCNGVNHSCQAYLTFRSQPLYNSVSTISALLSADPSEVAQINSVSRNATFETNNLVIVPITCSCAGQYYQSNTSYIVQNADTTMLIANNTFGGLTTCQALDYQNNAPRGAIDDGQKLNVPLRCACPTKNQIDKGFNYLLSYLVTWDDSIETISETFGVPSDITFEANSLPDESDIYPFTTLLVPLENPPSSSQNIRPFSPPGKPQPPPPPAASSDGNSNKRWVYIVVGIVGAVAFISVLGAIIFCKIKNKGDSEVVSESTIEATGKSEGKKVVEKSAELSEIISGMAQSLHVYDFKELQHATDNFSPSSRIKESVYRGIINGDSAAIKKVDEDVSKEIELLKKVTHYNIIRLSGICFNEGYWYLVYEYAANGPLSDWIYCKSNIAGKFLTWTQRMQIALDVATGIDYLHSFISPPHIHKDLKSDNIFLGSDFRAKIANLGLARSVEGKDDEFPMTKHIVGTRGYMAPEYLENGLVSTKLDVYALGVLMLEMLTGKEVSAICTKDKEDLSDVLRDIVGEETGYEKMRGFMDPLLEGNYPLDLALSVVRLIDNCIKKDPASRSAMHVISASLSRILSFSLAWESSVNIPGH